MYQELLESVEKTAGFPVNCPKDCTALAEEILVRTGRTISATTLRRFFGLLNHKSEISTFNLDTLSIYAGHSDFKEFLRIQTGERNKSRPAISDVLIELKQITDFTLASISRKSLTPFQHTIPRLGIQAMLERFLDSDRMIFPLIAPGGYGKSIALAHWVKSLLQQADCAYYPLFGTAPVLYKKISQSTARTGKISLDPIDPQNLCRLFEIDKNAYKKALLLIVDGIDEIEGEPRKILEMISVLLELASAYRRGGMLKIVLSVREVIWKNYILSDLKPGFPDWIIEIPKTSMEQGASNVPTLTRAEVRKILESLPEGQRWQTIHECLSWDVKQSIRIPMNLYFFRTLLINSIDLSRITTEKLMSLFLNSYIFTSRFADEKEDIIWGLVSSSLARDTAMTKRSLRDLFPIHLKREANYYLAYEQLLSDGILQEEKTENDYGLLATTVRFRHQELYYYFTAQYLVMGKGGFSHDIFYNVSRSVKNIQWKSNVLALLFQMAYQKEDFESLKDLCLLDEAILSTLPVRQAVCNAFRNRNSITAALVSAYAAQPVGQVQFFEMFVDTNYLFSGFSFRIREYLKHKHTLEATLFGHSILFLESFIAMDREECEREMCEIYRLEPDEHVHPWPIGRKVGNTLLFHFIVQRNQDVDQNLDVVLLIDKYRALAYKYPGYLDKGAIEFEIMVLLSLTLAGRFRDVVQLGETAFRSYRQSESNGQNLVWRHRHQNAFARCYMEYARYKTEGAIESWGPKGWEALLDDFMSVFDDFQNLIMVHYFLFDFNMRDGCPEKGRYYFEAALEISRLAKYTFYEIFLLAKGAFLDPSFAELAKKRIQSSEFNEKAYCFQPEQYV